MSFYFSPAKRECRSSIIKRSRKKSVIDTKFVLLIEDAFSVLYWLEQSGQFFMIAKSNYVNKLIYPLHIFSLMIRLVEYAMKLI